MWLGQIAPHSQSKMHKEERNPFRLPFLPSPILAKTRADGAHEEGGAGGEDGQSLPIVLVVQVGTHNSFEQQWLCYYKGPFF